ncbi:MAG: phospholipase D family protein [Conexivisphaera sp.]
MILASGMELLGPGVRAFDSSLAELLDSAGSEVQVAVYRMDPWREFFDSLRRVADRGVRLTVILNDAKRQHPATQDFLCRLVRDHANVSAMDFHRNGGILHVKAVVVDRKRMVIGSANIGFGGLHGNYELGVLVEGDDAWTASILIDRLARLSGHLSCPGYRQRTGMSP